MTSLLRILRRTLRSPAALLVAGTLVLSACSGSSAEPYAAKVRSHVISQASFLREVQVLVDHPTLAAAVQGTQGQVAGAGKDTADAKLSAFWLGEVVAQQVVDREFHDRHLSVTAAQRTQLEQSLAQSFGAQDWAKIPKWFRDTLVDRQARTTAVQSAVTTPITDAAAQAYFAQNRAQICPSGKTVGHILVATQAEAQAVEADLAAGKSFADEARTKSTDTASAQNGGVLGCLGAQQFVAEFQNAANALAVGQTSAPVQSQYGWHVIQVTPVTYDSAKAQVAQALQQAQRQQFASLIIGRLAKTKIVVNPRFGVLVHDRSGFGISPPPAPKVRSKPAPSTTTLAPAGLSPSPTTAPGTAPSPAPSGG